MQAESTEHSVDARLPAWQLALFGLQHVLSMTASPDLFPGWAVWHGGAFSEVTPSGSIVWSYTDLYHHHDAQWLPNGNLLYTAVEPLPPEVAAQVRGGIPGSEAPGGIIYGDVVKEVRRDGTLVWLWRSWEHLEVVDYPLHDAFERYHWPMTNAVTPTSDGAVLLSFRSACAVAAVDKASGQVRWRIGGDIVAQQHCPTELDNGNVLIFDNGSFRPHSSMPFSRIIEVDPKQQRVVWEYKDQPPYAFYTPFMGCAQRLANGNTFITASNFGRLFEVTLDSKIVWEYVIPYFGAYPDAAAQRYLPGETNGVFRAHRYTQAQLPWLDSHR